MPEFGAPKPDGAQEKPLSLETPEDEAKRLALLEKASESAPGESEGGTRNYLEAQEKAADAALAVERAQAADEVRAQEVLRGIQEKAPVVLEPRVVEQVPTETSQATEEPVSGVKKFLQKLKFWERGKVAAEGSKESDATKSIKSGNITSARNVLVSRELPKRNNKDKAALLAEFNKMVSTQVETLVRTNDTEKMMMLFRDNDLDHIGSSNIASMPQEVIQSPEVQVKLASSVEQTFSGNRGYGVRKANEYVQLGLMSRESAQVLLQSEIFQDKLTEDIERAFSENRKLGADKANEYVGLGLMSRESAQALLQSEAFQEKLAEDIERVFTGNRENGVKKANEYVDLQLMSREKADQLISTLQSKKGV